jgi:hypothetical protein
MTNEHAQNIIVDSLPNEVMTNLMDNQLEELDEMYARLFKNSNSLVEHQWLFDTFQHDLELHKQMIENAVNVGLMKVPQATRLSAKLVNLFVTYKPFIQAR